MSSDGDLDEDELLQMALKEQSQRDLKYQNSSSSTNRKPVANYVQQPQQQRRPAVSSSSTVIQNQSLKSNNFAMKGAHKVAVDEDDDSEVEMLSISSGDEDTSKDRGVGTRDKGSGAAGGRSNREDDRVWDGEEPAYWKHVDEAELSRRVREMRETRSAPVAPKVERKTSTTVRKGFNSLMSLPRGTECVDPLGLGIIDNRTLRLITDNLETSPSKSDRDAVDSALREKLMYFSENFDPKLFISRIHHDTPAGDLEAGALALKTDLKGRNQQRKQLVKDNFDCFVSCKTTIDDIESKLKRIEEDPEGSGTSHLFNCMQGVTSVANRAFETLFERQAQAEKIRSVQGMLQRFRTIFNLPSTIRGSISKGEYDLAVREYKKAKSIALPSHVGILKRVLEEVERVMHEFKGTLYKSMEDPKIDLASLENIVRLVLELEPDSDPVWHYLNIQNQRIRGLLEKCTLDHETRMETLQNKARDKALSDAKWRQVQQELAQSSDTSYSLSLEDTHLPSDPQLTAEEVDALRGRYIHRLTAVVVHHIPAFWKVALSVFSGKFAKSSQVSAESNVNASATKTDEKIVDGKYSSHSLDEVASMIRTTLSAYEAKVHGAFSEIEESNILGSYMSNAIKELFKACQAFEAKESAPSTAVMALRTLHSALMKIYILRLCSWMRASTEEISKDETWIPVTILERNKSPYAISFLPLAFRTIMASAMDQITLMIQSLKNEAAKSEDIFMQLQEIRESIRLAFLNCFLDFSAHLENISGGLNKSEKESPHMQNGFSDEPQGKLSADLPGCIADPHKQLLIILSNIGFCKDELSSELYNKYKHIWSYPREGEEEDSDIQDLVMCFSGLEEKVLAQYTFAKANLIRTAAMNYLLDSGVQWGAAPVIKGVRDAAVELLHTLVAVHAEVFAGAKPLLDKTLGILVEGLIDTFLSLFHENQTKEFRSLDANGFCQLMLELDYFETILNPYFNPEARESLQSLQGVLLEKATESVIEAVETPGGHNRRPTRGSEEGDDRQGMTVSPDDLIAHAQHYSTELLQAELERTRINTSCFVESIPLDAVPEPAKASYKSSRGSIDSPSKNYRGSPGYGSPSFSGNRRR